MSHYSVPHFLFRGSLLGCLIFLSSGINAESSQPSITKQKTKLDFFSTSHKGSEYRLEVIQMPLGQVLKRIEAETQVPIHYSVLPEGMVTATCVGSTLKTILECLLDRKADLIVRYSAHKFQSKGTILETWVLGSRLDGVVAKNCPVPLEHNYIDASSLPENQQEEEVARLRTQELLKMARSENPEERASAIGAFLSEGGEDDPEITAALEHALTDEDGNVRAQAVSNLSRRGDSATNSAIVQEALLDSSPDVRMMAVDSITDDEALLRLAIQDSDETVRSLAALKLEQLTQDSNAVK